MGSAATEMSAAGAMRGAFASRAAVGDGDRGLRLAGHASSSFAFLLEVLTPRQSCFARRNFALHVTVASVICVSKAHRFDSDYTIDIAIYTPCAHAGTVF